MIDKYSEDEMLLLSGIQHFAFCERQWALIHIEHQWAENVRTVEGKHLHEHADDPYANETRGDLRVVRAMPLFSLALGLRGVADIVEFQKDTNAATKFVVKLDKRNSLWRPVPIEYKRGRPKSDDRDAVQLCAQAIALEEMMQISIMYGYLFYGQTRHRERIEFSLELRERVEVLSQRMHEMYKAGETPHATKGKSCSICSMKEICQPSLMIKHKKVQKYIAEMTASEED